MTRLILYIHAIFSFYLNFSAYDLTIPARGRALAKTDIQIGLPEGCYGRVGKLWDYTVTQILAFTERVLSNRIDRSGQTEGAVWSESALFAILSASFGRIIHIW